MLTTRPPWYEFEAMAALFKIATKATNPELPPVISHPCRVSGPCAGWCNLQMDNTVCDVLFFSFQEFLRLIFVSKERRPYVEDLMKHRWFTGSYFWCGCTSSRCRLEEQSLLCKTSFAPLFQWDCGRHMLNVYESAKASRNICHPGCRQRQEISACYELIKLLAFCQI